MGAQPKFYRYHYRGLKDHHNMYWATLFLDEVGNLAVVSDCFNGACRPFSCRSIRHFVLELDPKYPDYLAEKLVGRRTRFDPDKTFRRVKEHLLYSRRQNDITKEKAREAYDDLIKGFGKDAWRWNNVDDPKEWEYYLSDQYYEIYGSEWYENLTYSWDTGVLSFISNCLPGLQEEIRKELALEEQKSSMMGQLVV